MTFDLLKAFFFLFGFGFVEERKIEENSFANVKRNCWSHIFQNKTLFSMLKIFAFISRPMQLDTATHKHWLSKSTQNTIITREHAVSSETAIQKSDHHHPQVCNTQNHIFHRLLIYPWIFLMEIMFRERKLIN